MEKRKENKHALLIILIALVLVGGLYLTLDVRNSNETKKVSTPKNNIAVGYKIKDTKYNDNATTIELEFDGKQL